MSCTEDMGIGGIDSTTGGPSAIHIGVAALRESRSLVKSSILRCNSMTDAAASPVRWDCDSSNCCNRASPSCTSFSNTTFCSRALEMTASTRLTLFLPRSTKFLHAMICSSTGRTLALERAIRRASTKSFACGFPSPNAERAASKRCTSSVASAETLSGGRLGACRSGTSQADFCLVESPAADWLRLEFPGRTACWPTLGHLSDLGLGPRTICTQPSKTGADFHPPRGMTLRGLTTAKETTLHNLPHCARATGGPRRNDLSQNGYRCCCCNVFRQNPGRFPWFCFGMCLFPEENQQPVLGGKLFFQRKVAISIGRETKTHILQTKINEKNR